MTKKIEINVDVVDMEAYALAKVCKLENIFYLNFELSRKRAQCKKFLSSFTVSSELGTAVRQPNDLSHTSTGRLLLIPSKRLGHVGFDLRVGGVGVFVPLGVGGQLGGESPDDFFGIGVGELVVQFVGIVL